MALLVAAAGVAVADDFFSPLSPLLAPVIGKQQTLFSSSSSPNAWPCLFVTSSWPERTRSFRQGRCARRWRAGRGTARRRPGCRGTGATATPAGSRCTSAIASGSSPASSPTVSKLKCPHTRVHILLINGRQPMAKLSLSVVPVAASVGSS